MNLKAWVNFMRVDLQMPPTRDGEAYASAHVRWMVSAPPVENVLCASEVL